MLADPFEPAALVATAEAAVPLALASWSLSAPLPGFVARLLEGAAEWTGCDERSALAHAARAARFSPLPADLDDVPAASWPEPVRWHPSPHIPRRPAGGGAEPFVYATLGTVVGSIPPLANHFLACLGAAVREVGATSVVTVGRAATLEALEIPPGVEVAPFLSHAEVMPRADVVVSHGGINTVLDAAACGVPQVVVPMQASDQHATAHRLTAHGAGIGVAADQQSPSGVTDALRAVTTSPAFGERARHLADEMARLPGTRAAWQTFEERYC